MFINFAEYGYIEYLDDTYVLIQIKFISHIDWHSM